MAKNSKLVQGALIAILGLFIAVAMTITVYPMVTGGSQDVGLSQNTNQTYEVVKGLDSNVVGIATGDATVELTGIDGQTTSVTLAQGESQEVSFGGANINVTADSVGTDEASLTYNVPDDYGTGLGGSLMVLLVPLLFLAGIVGWIFNIVDL